MVFSSSSPSSSSLLLRVCISRHTHTHTYTNAIVYVSKLTYVQFRWPSQFCLSFFKPSRHPHSLSLSLTSHFGSLDSHFRSSSLSLSLLNFFLRLQYPCYDDQRRNLQYFHSFTLADAFVRFFSRSLALVFPLSFSLSRCVLSSLCTGLSWPCLTFCIVGDVFFT